MLRIILLLSHPLQICELLAGGEDALEVVGGGGGGGVVMQAAVCAVRRARVLEGVGAVRSVVLLGGQF